MRISPVTFNYGIRQNVQNQKVASSPVSFGAGDVMSQREISNALERFNKETRQEAGLIAKKLANNIKKNYSEPKSARSDKELAKLIEALTSGMQPSEDWEGLGAFKALTTMSDEEISALGKLSNEEIKALNTLSGDKFKASGFAKLLPFLAQNKDED